MYQRASRQKIKDLVAENFAYASVLHFFGIKFYEVTEETLGKICRARSLDLPTVLRSLESVAASQHHEVDYSLRDLPVDMLIGYLQKAHRSFIRHKLPYMTDIISNIEPSRFDEPEVAADLKFVFPLFAEDFVHHIYEEEKNSFGYIEKLKQAVEGQVSASQLFEQLNSHSIAAMQQEHLEDDDEMQGIRELTDNYRVEASTGLYTRVVYLELQAFEKDLMVHSGIENDILLPRAAELEAQAIELLRQKALLN